MGTKELIEHIRLKKGWNQTELAGALGVSQRSVSAYEKGEMKPSKKVQKNLEVLTAEILASTEVVANKTSKFLTIDQIHAETEHELLLMMVGELKGVRSSYSELVDKISAVLSNCEELLKDPHVRGIKPPGVKVKQISGGP